jgi:hypothetical protein
MMHLSFIMRAKPRSYLQSLLTTGVLVLRHNQQSVTSHVTNISTNHGQVYNTKMAAPISADKHSFIM